MIVKVLPALVFFSYLTADLAFHHRLEVPFSYDTKRNIHQEEIGQQVLRGNPADFVPHHEKEKMKLSLWLIPPGGEVGDNSVGIDVNGSSSGSSSNNNGVYERTTQVIDELSEKFNGPRFTPHVTIVGGIKVDSEEEANALSKRLREGLANFGAVQCNFRKVLREPTCWNQALIVEMVPSESFLQLCTLARRILNMELEGKGDGITFPPPSGVPHMSLFYGDYSNPDLTTNHQNYISRIVGSGNGDDKKSFQSHRVMLWKTEPSSASGVPEWEPLADISLGEVESDSFGSHH